MIDFISSKQDFIQATNELHQIFQKGVDIVENPFLEDFTIFRGFEFDRIYSKNFYSGLAHFLDNRGSKEFTFYTLFPTPDEYFFRYFLKYSVGKINKHTAYEDYLDFLSTDPGNSSADALLYNAETIAMFSNEPIWGIIGSKDLQIGIVGFKDEKIKTEFVSCFNKNVFIDIKTRLNDLNEMLKLQPETKDIHLQIIYNYSQKKN